MSSGPELEIVSRVFGFLVKNRNFGRKSTFLSKIEVFFMKDRNFNSNFDFENRHFDRKSKFLSMIEILVKNRNVGERSKFWSKIEILVKSRKSKFWSNIEILFKKGFWLRVGENFGWNITCKLGSNLTSTPIVDADVCNIPAATWLSAFGSTPSNTVKPEFDNNWEAKIIYLGTNSAFITFYKRTGDYGWPVQKNFCRPSHEIFPKIALKTPKFHKNYRPSSRPPKSIARPFIRGGMSTGN